MGDRGNIRFDFGPVVRFQAEQHPSIYLYAHNHGYDMPIMLRDALHAGHDRWGDDSYLCRIIVSHMVHQDQASLETTGWGLSPFITDNEYPVTVCDLERSTVQIGTARWTFAEYVKLDSATIRQVYGASQRGEPQT